MKQFWKILKRYAPWLLLLLLIDGFSTLLLWLCDAQAFQFLMGLIVLASLVLFSATVLFFYIKERQKQAFFRDFLTEPDAVSTEGCWVR